MIARTIVAAFSSSSFTAGRYLSVTGGKLSDEICSRRLRAGVEISYDYLARRGIPFFVNTSTSAKDMDAI